MSFLDQGSLAERLTQRFGRLALLPLGLVAIVGAPIGCLGWLFSGVTLAFMLAGTRSLVSSWLGVIWWVAPIGIALGVWRLSARFGTGEFLERLVAFGLASLVFQQAFLFGLSLIPLDWLR